MHKSTTTSDEETMTTIQHFSAAQLHSQLDEFVDMLKLTVDGGASIGWILPFSIEEATRYWYGVAEQLETGNKILIVAQHDTTIVGAIQLGLEPRENGNHRAEVQKLMVHPNYRRQGIARQLMRHMIDTAKSADRQLLILDVRKGDPAEKLYQQLGFIHVGDIPDYARRNKTEFDATAYYYKPI
jgi:ribosomal protein S18 acetylase RimI-like enzyme